MAINNKSVVLYVLISVCHLASASTSSTYQVISCPGDVLTTECAITGVGATAWLGTAFQCDSSHDEIILRHSQFGGPYNTIRSCNNGEIVVQSLGVVNNSYISQLSVTVSPELNNTTVECWYINDITLTVIRSIQIIVLGKHARIYLMSHRQCIRTSEKVIHTCMYMYMYGS